LPRASGCRSRRSPPSQARSSRCLRQAARGSSHAPLPNAQDRPAWERTLAAAAQRASCGPRQLMALAARPALKTSPNTSRIRSARASTPTSASNSRGSTRRLMPGTTGKGAAVPLVRRRLMADSGTKPSAILYRIRRSGAPVREARSRMFMTGPFRQSFCQEGQGSAGACAHGRLRAMARAAANGQEYRHRPQRARNRGSALTRCRQWVHAIWARGSTVPRCHDSVEL
jgi:hypothetical protein